MAFSAYTISDQNIRIEEYTEIRIVNASAPSTVYLECNNFMVKMEVDRDVANGYKKKLYGWMVYTGDNLDITFIGSNADIQTQAGQLSVSESDNPILPIIDFLLDYLKTHPILSTYAKVYETIRKPFKFITTRPQFLVTMPDIDIFFPQIGDPEHEWEEVLHIIYIDDIREPTDLQRHGRFLKIMDDYLRNNPNLNHNLGCIDIDVVKAQMPNETMDNIYLHQSTLICMLSIIPEYTI